MQTFGAVAEEFLFLHVATKRKGRTGSEYRRILQSSVVPAIGSKRIADVHRTDVAILHGKLVDTPYEANRALALVSAVWNWAAKRGEVALGDNPAKEIERYREHRRERFLSCEELARLSDTLREGETVGLPYEIDESKPGAKHAPKADKRRVTLDPYAVAAIRLLILTGARLRQILDVQWEHLDFERGILFLLNSKTGRNPVYLSAAALEVLTGLSPIEGNLHIIPGEKAGQPKADLKKPWRAVTRAAGLEGVRIHGLRHSLASIGAGA